MISIALQIEFIIDAIWPVTIRPAMTDGASQRSARFLHSTRPEHENVLRSRPRETKVSTSNNDGLRRTVLPPLSVTLNMSETGAASTIVAPSVASTPAMTKLDGRQSTTSPSLHATFMSEPDIANLSVWLECLISGTEARCSARTWSMNAPLAESVHIDWREDFKRKINSFTLL